MLGLCQISCGFTRNMNTLQKLDLLLKIPDTFPELNSYSNLNQQDKYNFFKIVRFFFKFTRRGLTEIVRLDCVHFMSV